MTYTCLSCLFQLHISQTKYWKYSADSTQVWDTTSKCVLMKSCIEVKKGSSGPVPCTLSMDGTIAVAGIHGKLKVCRNNLLMSWIESQLLQFIDLECRTGWTTCLMGLWDDWNWWIDTNYVHTWWKTNINISREQNSGIVTRQCYSGVFW